jgi:hypothetical protein
MSGSTVTIVPATGPDVTIKYTTLPPNITDFGFKTITLSHPSMPGATTTAQVEIYFLVNKEVGEDIRSVTNWPGASPVTPWYMSPAPRDAPNFRYTADNSYHYYNQVPDAPKGCPWNHYGSLCDPQNPSLSYPPSFACYTPFVGPLGSPSQKPNYVDQRSGIAIKWSGVKLWGLNAFAWASRHETTHHNDYETWWGIDGVDPEYDEDSDRVPDSLEPGFPPAEGGPYISGLTHPSIGLDDQAHCEFTHATDWEIVDGDKNTKDWGYPGARWNPGP